MKQKHDWPTLVDAHARSGLTQKAFCEQQGVHPVTFSQKRSKLLGGVRRHAEATPSPSAFVRAQPSGSAPVRHPLELSLGTITLRFGPDTAPSYVAALVEALS